MDIIRCSYYILSPWCNKISFCVLCVTQWWTLHIVIKREFLKNIYISCFSISIHSWDTTTSALRKQTGAIKNSTSGFDFELFIVIGIVILHRRSKFYPNWTISVMMLFRFAKMAALWRPYHRKSTFAFSFYDVSHLGRQRTIRIPNFDQIVSTNGRYITTSGCRKQTSTIFIFYSRFWFYKMAAIASQIYFRFLVWPRLIFKKV